MSIDFESYLKKLEEPLAIEETQSEKGKDFLRRQVNTLHDWAVDYHTQFLSGKDFSQVVTLTREFQIARTILVCKYGYEEYLAKFGKVK